MAAERHKPRDTTDESGTPAPTKDKRADYLTARQLAEVLQVSETTIHRLRRAGRIPAVMLTDRLIRFNLREVQKALRPQTLHVHAPDGGETSDERELSPQLSFEDLYSRLDPEDAG